MKFKLDTEQVKAYEDSSGFKTFGDITVETCSDEVFDILMSLL
jgi:hypothetical protein